MKKTITGIIGIAAIAALVGIACNDVGDSDSKGAKAFLDRYHGGDKPVVPDDSCAGNTPAQGCKDKDTAKTYKLTVSSNDSSGGGTVSRNPGKSAYNAGDTVTVTAAPDSGYRFTGWTGAVEDTANPVTIIMDADKKLTANFVWQDTTSRPPPDTTYTLNVSASPQSGGTVSLNPDKSDYKKGADVTATAMPNPSYRFTGWSGASTETADSITITMDSSITLTAKFIRVYTVTFDANGATGTAPAAITADSGISVTLPDSSGLTRSGHTFGGWNSKNDSTGNNYDVKNTYTPDSSITLYAKWNAVPTTTTYTITFKYNYDGSEDTTVTTGTDGKLTSLPTPTRTYYTFDGWYTAATGGTVVTKDSAFSKDTTIYAQWIQVFKDTRDDKGYKWVTIGNQVWMAENLNYNASGSKCGNESNGLLTESDGDCAKYGRLYTWSTAMNDADSSSKNPSEVQGVCPADWHLPSDAEWTTLVKHVDSSTAGTKLKSTSGWHDYEGVSGNGADNYGFSALPGGHGNNNGNFSSVGKYGIWWSATKTRSQQGNTPRIWKMDYTNGRVTVENNSDFLYSVRCVRD